MTFITKMKYPGHTERTVVFDLVVDPCKLKNLAAQVAAEIEAVLKK